MGLTTTCTPDVLADLVNRTLRLLPEDQRRVAGLATLETRADHPAVRALAQHLGVGLKTYSAADLEAQGGRVPSPSVMARNTVGTSSVAEAAALLSAGPEAYLIIPKQTARTATCAIAVRQEPQK